MCETTNDDEVCYMSNEFKIKEYKEELGEIQAKLEERKTQQRSSGEPWSEEVQAEVQADLQRRSDLQGLIKTEELQLQMGNFENAPTKERSKMIPHFTTKQKMNTLTDEEQNLAVRSMCMQAFGMDGDITDDMHDIVKRAGLNLRSHKIRGTFVAGASTAGIMQRAQNTDGSANLGYNTLNESVAAGIEKVLVDSGGMFAAAKLFPTEEGSDRHWTIFDDSANLADKYAQNDDTTNDSIFFTKKVIKVASYRTGVFPISKEVIQDSQFPILDHITECVGDRLFNKANLALTTGDGTGDNCEGIVTAAGVGFQQTDGTAMTGDISYSDLVEVEHSIAGKYRKNALWMMHDSTLKALKLLTNESTGQPLWVPSLSVGAPSTLLGYNIVVNNDMPELGSASKKVVLFGDFSKYIIRRARNVEIQTLYERFADLNALGCLGWMRLGGGLIVPAAVKALVTQES